MFPQHSEIHTSNNDHRVCHVPGLIVSETWADLVIHDVSLMLVIELRNGETDALAIDCPSSWAPKYATIEYKSTLFLH